MYPNRNSEPSSHRLHGFCRSGAKPDKNLVTKGPSFEHTLLIHSLRPASATCSCSKGWRYIAKPNANDTDEQIERSIRRGFQFHIDWQAGKFDGIAYFEE